MIENKPIEKQFLKFAVPSMLAMLLNGFYTMVDGFFIGRAVGDTGLAGIGIAWPITAVLLALGVGIGTGGAVLTSIRRGEGDHQGAGQSQVNTFFLLAVTSLLTTAVLIFAYPSILRWMGAQGDVYTAAAEYTHYIAWGGSLQILASGVTPLIRNNHRTVQAMLIMCSGLVTNIVLDAWFLMELDMGLGGAALATILAQGVTLVLCIFSLTAEKEYRITAACCKLRKFDLRRILVIGLSPFGLSLMPSLISLFNNWQCLAYGGDNAVAAYCVSNYLIGALMLLLQGVGDGIQPLISFCVGGGLNTSRRVILRKGASLVLGMSAAFFLLSFPLRFLLPPMFGTSPETGEIIHRALPLLGIAFPFMGIVKFYTSSFYASGRTVESMVLVYADPVLLTPVFLLLLPRLWQLDGVWLALPAAQIVLTVLLGWLLYRHRKDVSPSEREGRV